MKDYEFLTWIKSRLINVYNESPNVDFVRKLDEIINKIMDNENSDSEVNICRLCDHEFDEENPVDEHEKDICLECAEYGRQDGGLISINEHKLRNFIKDNIKESKRILEETDPLF